MTDALGAILADAEVGVTLVPAEGSAAVRAVEDIGSVTVSVSGYDATSVDAFTVAPSTGSLGATTLSLGEVRLAGVSCDAYSQALTELADIEASAVASHNLGVDTSDPAAAAELFESALVAQRLLLEGIAALVAQVGEGTEVGALLVEAEGLQSEAIDLYDLGYGLWADADEAYAQGDHAYDQGDYAYDLGDAAYDRGDDDAFNDFYDQGDAWYGQGEAFYIQGDTLIDEGNALVDAAEAKREEAWRLLDRTRDLVCGGEKPAATDIT